MSLRVTTVDGRKLEGQAAFDYWVTALADHGQGSLRPDGRGGYVDTKTGKTYPAGSFKMGSGFSGPGLSIGGDQWLTPDGGVHDQHTALKIITALAIPLGASAFGSGAGAGTGAGTAGAGGAGSAGTTAAVGLGAGGFEKWMSRVVGLASLVGGGINSYVSGENQAELIKLQQERLALEKQQQADAEKARQAKIQRLSPYTDLGARAFTHLGELMGYPAGGAPTGAPQGSPPPPQTNAPPSGAPTEYIPSEPMGGTPGQAPQAPQAPMTMGQFGPSSLGGLPQNVQGGEATVKMVGPDGSTGNVPQSKVARALALGFQRVN